MNETNSFVLRAYQESVRVCLYVDESKAQKNADGHHWMYIIVLCIPASNIQEALECLLQIKSSRSVDGEMHFSRIGRADKKECAKGWLDLVAYDEKKMFHFYILGIDMDNLHQEAFGYSRERKRNIYNRFFRTSLAGSLRYFFGKYSNIYVSNVFHDRSELENDRYFDWHAIWRLEETYNNIKFSNDRIEFIDSDHRKETLHPEHSHFIQLADIVLGATRQQLDFTSEKKYKMEIAEHFRGFLESIMSGRNKRNYDYYRRCNISFFPKGTMKITELEDILNTGGSISGFYNTRECLQALRIGQTQLFRWDNG
jgi:hypothetical protein